MEALLAQGRYWYALPIESLILDRGTGSVTLEATSPLNPRVPAPGRFLARWKETMKVAERRQLSRLNLRTPLRFQALGVASDRSEHFTEALNVSRGGLFFSLSAPLLVGMSIVTPLRIPAEVTWKSVYERLSRDMIC